MKKIILLIGVLILGVCALTSCGQKYTCHSCDKTVSTAYYDMKADLDYVLCEDCAREYWMPFDYKTYRVK